MSIRVRNNILNFIFIFGILCLATGMSAQEPNGCELPNNKRAEKIYKKGLKDFQSNRYGPALASLNEVIDMETAHLDAHYLIGLIYISPNRLNIQAAEEHFQEVIDNCPTYNTYVYYHLARIAWEKEFYDEAYNYVSEFLTDIDAIQSDEDYREAVAIQDYSKFYDQVFNNPVPFDPKPVAGISTEEDEYLPIISPDNEMALFTRRVKIPPRRDDLTPQVRYKEQFIFSRKIDEQFTKGNMMPYPFNRYDNEGGATLTIDNKKLYYTLCRYGDNSRYYNCDICYSEQVNGQWMPIESISDNVNLPNTWESQPSITSDGNTLYFVSDRPGGLGGYDIYKTEKNELGEWSVPVNLGNRINTAGNEKSPFIHTDSQTLYFSSEGRMGLGGYDIFYSRLDSLNNWSKPKNIGYPINSSDDDVGFFVSTDGQKGYFASNKFNGIGGWDLYTFDLYEEARPEKVLFVKGKIERMKGSTFRNTRVELTNASSNRVTSIPVDSITGEYVAAVVFRDDYLMTVKRKGYVNETRYLSKIDTRNTQPIKLFIDLKPIEVGMSYQLNDIYFDFNSSNLKPESQKVIRAFADFLTENPTLKVSIEGHTDNVGSAQDNLKLSEERAASVYHYLISLGIDPARTSYKGLGESRPVVSNNTEDGRARNRRTEFVIVEK